MSSPTPIASVVRRAPDVTDAEGRATNYLYDDFGRLVLVQSPCEEPLEFVPMLIEIGLLKERKDGRLETTDLYLDGLGFKRKGGVRRRLSPVTRKGAR